MFPLGKLSSFIVNTKYLRTRTNLQGSFYDKWSTELVHAWGYMSKWKCIYLCGFNLTKLKAWKIYPVTVQVKLFPKRLHDKLL